MHEQLIRFAHGIVAFPVVAACADRNLFDLLRERGPQNAEQLAAAMGANSGHLLVALRLLQSLGWLEVDAAGGYKAAKASESASRVPRDLLSILELPLGKCLTDLDRIGPIADWLRRSARKWDQPDPQLAELADGLLLGLLLLGLREIDPQGSAVTGGRAFAPCCPAVREALEGHFLDRGWAEGASSGVNLTAAGRSLLERSLVLGITASYRPLLARLPQLLFGDARSVMERTSSGDEGHVERTLNVVSSGFQHNKFFGDLDALVTQVFDNDQFDEQPRYVADMGCGDGTLLRRIYETVRHHTARGRSLERHPLTLIGIDFNWAALEATAATLQGIPHLLVTGDVGDPARLLADLKERGIDDPDRILHVRSFLDHDRPFRAPRDAVRAELWQAASSRSLAVDADGRLVPSGGVIQSLVEHFRGWAEITGSNGLVVLEVHNLAPETARQFADQSESLHFDAFHGFSGQQLVEAETYLLAAAAAGLFPRLPYAGRYPRLLPFVRITWNWFERRPYILRPAHAGDMTDLLELERRCWSPAMCLSAEAIAQRVERNPGGQFVVERDGRVVAVVYTQRIGSVESLRSTPFADLSSLIDPNGAVLQLLSLNVLPEYQGQGLADQIARFVLHWALLQPGIERVAGVTRCRDYRREPGVSLAEYLARRDDQGRVNDPIVRFHQGNGAKILGLVPNFRPEDEDNASCGVLIAYELGEILHRLTFQETASQSAVAAAPVASAQSSVAASVERCVRKVLHQAQQSAYSSERPFKDLGLDSLDLMELRTLLGKELSVTLEPMLFFRHPTPQAVCRYLEERLLPSDAISSANGSAGGPHESNDPAADEDSLLAELLDEIEQTPEDEARQLLADSRLKEAP